MHESIKQERFRDLAHNPRILNFAREILIQSYVECAPGQEEPMRRLLERAFATLAETSGDEAQFQQAVDSLVSQVFRKGDPQFWFNSLYQEYKSRLKPTMRFRKLQPWIRGRRVFDLGCGDGLTALALQQNGCEVALTDVLDYRAEAARLLPFRPMTDPRVIPYPEGDFDTALVMAVLHHVDEENLLPLLGELRRVSRRLIVEEDSYAVPPELPGFAETLAADRQLQTFVRLPGEDQLRYLMFVDYFANAITQGLPQMHMPFHFQTVEEWQALFAGQGFRVARVVVQGFQQGYFNRSCHVWFILDAI